MMCAGAVGDGGGGGAVVFALVAFGLAGLGLGVVSGGDEGGLVHGVLSRLLPARLWVVALRVVPELRWVGVRPV